MYNYSLVYVLVDDSNLTYYNVLMKSVLSVRLHMPDIEINVFTDEGTSTILHNTKADLYNYAKVNVIRIPIDYNTKEKSRFLKTNVRRLTIGDFLYVDIDTIICRPFPDVISEKSFAIAQNLNAPFELLHTPYTYKVHEKFNLLDVTKLKEYYNSGVMWVKDDKYGHDIFSQWNKIWEETRGANLYYDQPSLNYVLHNFTNGLNFEMLDNVWNVQIAGSCNAGIKYLLDAYIIHYFHLPDCAFLLCEEKYYYLPYNDTETLRIIKDPLRAFGIGKLSSHKVVPYDEYMKNEAEKYYKKQIEKSYQYRLLWKIFFNKRLFIINEKILNFLANIKNNIRNIYSGVILH